LSLPRDNSRDAAAGGGMTEIIGPVQDVGADIAPSPSMEQAREFIRASKADSTLRGYKSDWRHFCNWSQERSLCPLPASPEAVASYIAECAGHLKVGSIQRRLNAIAEAHKAVGLESPTAAGIVKNTLKGIKRTLGTAAVQKAPALTDDVRAMVGMADCGLIGLRDRALILLGFAGAFRRSEVVSLDVSDLDFGRDGLAITLRRSKTDQEGQCRKVGIPYGSNPETCPVRILHSWLEATGIASGPVFRAINRHGQVRQSRLAPAEVARIVKKLALRAGLDPTNYAGHSLRAGHATRDPS
jgi:site-specific recombinase XerD